MPQTAQQVQNSMNPTPVTLATPSSGQVYRSSGGGLYSRQGDTLYMTSSSDPSVAKALQAAGVDINSIPVYGDQQIADMNQSRNGSFSNVKSVDQRDANLASYFAPSSVGTSTQTVNTQPNTIDPKAIAASSAAQTQQLAGDQGMNVTQSTTPEGVSGVTKTPLGTPAQTGQQAFQSTQTGQQSAPGAVDPQTGKPFTGAQMSSLDQLKSSLLQASSQLAGMGAPPNKDLADKYNAVFDSLKSTQSPPGGSAGRDGVNDALSLVNKSTDSQLSPSAQFLQNYSSLNPVEQGYFNMVNQILAPTSTQTTLTQEYANLQASTGLQGLQTDLMNIENVMNGSEDDIRTEIQKAGGFATESQVQALTTARNKTLLKQASLLQEQINQKQDYINQVIQLTGADRAQAEKDIDRKLGLAETFTNLQIQMDKASADNYNNIIKNVGYDGLASALNHNPQAMASAEKSLGLPSGALSSEAFMALAAKNDQKLQFISGTPNQASGYFDPATGKFTPYGGSGGGTGGGTSGGVASIPAVQQAIDTITGSFNFTKQQKADFVNSVNNSPNPLATIENRAKDVMGQTSATSVTNYEKAQDAMLSLQDTLKQYYDKGGKTNIFSGNYEEVSAKLGTVADPELRTLATKIEAALQIYRNAVSGTAYSVQEGKAIASIFPGIDKTEGLNKAIIDGRMAVFNDTIDSAYAHVLGQDTYNALKAQYGTSKSSSSSSSGTLPPGSVVTKNGIQYMVGPDGESLTQVTNNINYGAITSGSVNGGKSFF